MRLTRRSMIEQLCLNRPGALCGELRCVSRRERPWDSSFTPTPFERRQTGACLPVSVFRRRRGSSNTPERKTPAVSRSVSASWTIPRPTPSANVLAPHP